MKIKIKQRVKLMKHNPDIINDIKWDKIWNNRLYTKLPGKRTGTEYHTKRGRQHFFWYSTEVICWIWAPMVGIHDTIPDQIFGKSLVSDYEHCHYFHMDYHEPRLDTWSDTIRCIGYKNRNKIAKVIEIMGTGGKSYSAGIAEGRETATGDLFRINIYRRTIGIRGS